MPPFLVKNKEVAFPKIRNAMNLVKEELEQREVIIAETGEVLSDRAGSSGSGSKYGNGGIPATFKPSKGGKQVTSNNGRSRKRMGKF